MIIHQRGEHKIKSDLTSHIKIALAKEEEPSGAKESLTVDEANVISMSFSCPICTLAFLNMEKLNGHAIHAHPRAVGFACRKCAFTALSFRTVRRHLKR